MVARLTVIFGVVGVVAIIVVIAFVAAHSLSGGTNAEPVQAEVAVHPGELLRAPALPEVYWIDDQGRKRWIASPDVQQKCAFGATRTVPEGTLQKIADGPDITGCEDGSPTSDQPAVQAGEVVKGSTQPAIYVIDDRGRKRWIPTEEVRTSCGYTDIRSVPESLIRRLPDGPELTACAASEDRG